MASELAIPPAQERRDSAEIAIAGVAGIALALVLLFVLAVPAAGNLSAARDFVSYWATGQQLVHHHNPYDRVAIAAIEHSAGLDPRATLIMRNPPWALPLVLPLGLLGPRIGAILWTLILLGCLLLSVWMVHELHGAPPSRTSLFSLLGLVLFFRLYLTRPFLAGAALWLCALKPHLFLPFAAALALWIVVSRSYKVLAGFIAALAVSSIAASLVDPRAWRDYIQLMRSPAVENDFIPCLAVAARQWFFPNVPWLQYLPAAICCVWALIYYWQRRAHWDWVANGSPLMLVSLVFAPYCWLYDQCLAMPALIHGAYTTRTRSLLALLALLSLAACIELGFVKVISPWWLWTAPVWFAWYLVAAHRKAASAAS
jgi:hypothetical protein